MSKRREYTRNLKCIHSGCSEYGHYRYETRREYDSAIRENRPYICSLHSLPNRVLSPTRLRTEWISDPAAPSERYPNIPRTELFFGSWGLLIDRAYYAKANDFPIGTRIKITAEVILPEVAE